MSWEISLDARRIAVAIAMLRAVDVVVGNKHVMKANEGMVAEIRGQQCCTRQLLAGRQGRDIECDWSAECSIAR